MITNNEEAWDSRDNNRNDFDNTDHTFGRQNEDAFTNSDLDSDELKEDEDDNTDLAPTFDQGDLNDEDEEYDRPNEIPEEGESKKEGTGYHHQSEVDQPQRGANTSYSEQTDVTPPNKKEFPSTGPAKTDFASRPQGRTTGRMVGHEPGTEGI
jgi:hypothetical protein